VAGRGDGRPRRFRFAQKAVVSAGARLTLAPDEMQE
jgi:hypothetical protein